MKADGYIIEILTEYKTKTKTFHVWERRWNSKIYKSVEIAEDAYNQCPDCYKSNDLEVRIVPLYRGEKPDYIIIGGRNKK